MPIGSVATHMHDLSQKEIVAAMKKMPKQPA